MTVAEVPHRLADAVARRPLVEVAPDRALVRLPNVGRVLVGSDGSVRRTPAPGVRVGQLAFLDDVVDALGMLLGGGFPLRASAVEIGGAAVVLCAQSPAGKSTVATALARRGHRFLGDSVVSISVRDGRAEASCPARGAVLWPDAIERLGLDPAEGRPVREGLEALRFPYPDEAAAVPVSTIVALRRWADDETGRPARGFDALTTLVHACWHRFAIRALGRAPAQFEWAVAVSRCTRVVTIDVPQGRPDPQEVADAVLEVAGPGDAS